MSRALKDNPFQNKEIEKFLDLIDKGEFEAVKNLTDIDQLIRGINSHGDTALHVVTNDKHRNTSNLLPYLCHSGLKEFYENYKKERPEFIRWLLKKKVDINAKDNMGDTALMVSTDKEVIQLLLEHKADINSVNNVGQTALDLAITRGNADLVEYLIQCGAEIFEPSLALLILTKLRQELPPMPTLLRTAKYLLADSVRGYHPDCITQAKRIFLYIFDRCLNRQVVDLGGRTALHVAAEKGCMIAVIKLIDEAKLDPNQKDFRGKTPFLCARSVPMQKLLIDKGADYKACCNQGATAFHYLVGHDWEDNWESKKNLEEMIIFLRDSGLDINAQDKYGKSPLMYVRYCMIAELLIKFGANPILTDNTGSTALDLLKKLMQDDPAMVNKDLIKLLGKAQLESCKKLPDEKIKNNEKIIKFAFEESDLELISRSTSAKQSGIHYAIYNLLLSVSALRKKAVKQGFNSIIYRLNQTAEDEEKKELQLQQEKAQTIFNWVLNIPNLDLTVLNEQQQTPLHMAAELGFDEAYKVLAQKHRQLKIKPDVRQVDQKGYTLLMSAIIGGCNFETIRHLVMTLDTNIAAPSSDGKTVETYLNQYLSRPPRPIIDHEFRPIYGQKEKPLESVSLMMHTLPVDYEVKVVTISNQTEANYNDGRTWLSALISLGLFFPAKGVCDLALQYVTDSQHGENYKSHS